MCYRSIYICPVNVTKYNKYANKNINPTNTPRPLGYSQNMNRIPLDYVRKTKTCITKAWPNPSKERENILSGMMWWDSLHMQFYPWTDEMSHWQFNSEFLYTMSYWLHYKLMKSIPHAVSSSSFLFILNLCFMDPDSISSLFPNSQLFYLFFVWNFICSLSLSFFYHLCALCRALLDTCALHMDPNGGIKGLH